MSKTDMRCDKCGGALYLDEGAKSATCSECGSREIFIEDIHMNDKMVFAVKVNDNINTYLGKAEAFLEMKEYAKAFELFAKAINVDPNDYRGWWGSCRCRILDNYLCVDNGYSDDFRKVRVLAPENQLAELEARYDTYLDILSKKKEALDKAHEKAIMTAKGEIYNIDANPGPRKKYNFDIFITVVLFSLVPFAVWLGIVSYAYRWPGFILAVMFVIGGVFLFVKISRYKKIVEAIEKGGCNTVSSLIKILGKTKKQDVMRDLKEVIRNAFLVGYSVSDGEYITFNPEIVLKEKPQKTKKTAHDKE